MLGPVVLDIAGLTLTAEDRERIAHPLAGMVILFTRNYADPAQLAELTAAIHAVKPGVLVSVDHEGGRVQRFREGFTAIPPMSAYGRQWLADSEAAARSATAAGFVMASELRACGVDFSFAPVLDLDWGRSKVIGDRAFALDPRVVTRLARAFSHGMAAAGMANCGKHFPGHGWAQADSHVALPVDERPAERILLGDAKPYSWMGAGLASVMTAHVTYSAFDALPATFSRKLLKDVLRDRLRFTGLVFSDDLSMEGAGAAGGIVERGAKALEAGCDALIVCNHPESADALLAGLAWRPTPEFAERAARIAPKGPAPRLAELRASAVWRTALEQMDPGAL
ncbi:MAG: beta-N-acetylhexosaminidase [Duodenibacillus sp.]|nr:beta-N-acetylhexosaminidase [Duodenibacillus sp.]